MTKIDKIKIRVIELPEDTSIYLIFANNHAATYDLYEGGEFVHKFLKYWLNRVSNE